jgi:hypothetical protein
MIPAMKNWYRKQKKKYLYPRRLLDMHARYGKREGQVCGNCLFFWRFFQNRRWYKCEKFSMSQGAATDWRVNWPACGRFVEKE